MSPSLTTSTLEQCAAAAGSCVTITTVVSCSPAPRARLIRELFRRAGEVAARTSDHDYSIGRVFEQIRAMRQWDNTLIVFLSDNGASAEIMVRDDGHDPEKSPGSADTYLCLGPGWSTSCNTPFEARSTA